jgi:Amidohydrolase
MERLLLVSSDDHAGARSSVYRQFLDGEFLDDFDRWFQAQRDRQGLKGMLENASQEVVAMLERNSSEELASFGTDLSKRLERLEREGIVAEVLFPEPAVGPTHHDFGVPFANLFAGAGDERLDLLAAGYRAHNRWLAETADHRRQAGLALIAFHDVDAAVTEIRDAARLGLRGIAVDGIHPDLPPLDDPVYEVVWSACEDEDLPVHFHTGNGGLGATRARGPRSDGTPVPHLDPVRMTEAGFFSQRPLTCLIFGGVCHRPRQVGGRQGEGTR